MLAATLIWIMLLAWMFQSAYVAAVEQQRLARVFGPAGVSFLMEACAIAVGNELKSSTTTFPRPEQSDTTFQRREGTAEVAGWVDAENLFGAPAHYTYRCTAMAVDLRWDVSQVALTPR